MAIDVFRPSYKITLNGKKINHIFVKSVIFVDEIDNSTDVVTVETTVEFARPNGGDELKLWIGVNHEKLIFMGVFHISETTISNRKLSFKATGANANANLKSRKNRAWERVSLSSVVSKIAGEYGLKSKCDSSLFLEHEAQSHESDLGFLKRLAKENNLTFSIKNKTIILIKKDAPMVWSCSIKEAKSITININSKSKYGKAVVTYRDHSKNKIEKVSVGSGEPILELQGSFKTKSKAKEWAKNKLDTAQRRTMKGTVVVVLNTSPIAGGKIKITDSIYDDGEYKIKRVTHNLMGGVTSIEFDG